MLDIKFIKKNEGEVRKAIIEKNKEVDLDLLLSLHDKKNSLQIELDNARAKQRKVSDEIAKTPENKRSKLIKKVSSLKKDVKKLESIYTPLQDKFEKLLYKVPNVTHPDMPNGAGESDNVAIRTFGTKQKFVFTPKEHWELGVEQDLLDFSKASEVSGARFWYIKGDLVRLHFALHQFAFDILSSELEIKKVAKKLGLKNISTKPFIPMLPPMMVRSSVQHAIHRVFGDETYSIEGEDLNLVASAEHTLAPYHMNEVLQEEELPKRYIGYSTAFRREAGTYGKDTKGLIRGHQFDKSELESFTTPESGEDEQKLIVGLQEYMMQKLGLHYQVVQICTGDTGSPDYQQYDIEAWLPGQGKYRETHTSDYMTDYQTRGINSYYTTKEGKKLLLHTNDATALSGRPMIAIMEQYQQEDGSILIPIVLHKYMGGLKLLQKKQILP